MIEQANAPSPRRLSEKQQDMLGRLARHQSIKTIAEEMGVSESRINQHIRAVKDRLGVNSQEEMVAYWLQSVADAPLRKTAYRKKQLPGSTGIGDQRPTVDVAMFTLRDAGVMPLTAPWEEQRQKRVGPGLLDGPGATTKRGVYIILVAIGLPLAVIVTLSAMMALGEMLRVFR